MEDNPALPDTESKIWERNNLGKSITHRLSKIGRDNFDYQASFIRDGEEPPDLGRTDAQKVKDYYFQQTGREALEMQAVIEEEEKQVKIMEKRANVGRALIRRKVKVANMDNDNDDSLKIDKEWNTSSWTDEMITAGMDYLFYVFVDPKVQASQYLKDKAMTMIDKLIVRHFAAEKHLRFKIEAIISRAISRFVKNGRSLAQLDLLCILHVGKETYRSELAEFNFTGRVMEMVSIECRLAAIIIQHRFRTWSGYKRRKKRNVNPITLTFGSDMVMNSLRESSIDARTADLKGLWKNMHVRMTEEQILTPSGFRGPCHVHENYTLIILEIVLSLVCTEAGDISQSNREDFCACNGSIMLASFISYPKAPYSPLSLKVASHVSKVAESVQPMLEAGIIYAMLRYMRYLEDTGKLKWLSDGKDNLPNRRDMSEDAYFESQIPKKQFFDCLLTATRLAVHAAGIFRARNGGHYCIVPKKLDVEEIDYREKATHLTGSYTGDMVRHTVGNKHFLRSMTRLMTTSKHLHCMRTMLNLYLSISCGDCHGSVLFEFVADASRLMNMVLNFIEEEDLTISTLSLCLFMQLCTIDDGRDTMLCSFLPQHLAPYTKKRKSYTRPSYVRGILINAALLRQHNWRSYDPERVPGIFSNTSYLRLAVYLDLMRTIKRPEHDIADGLTIADLTLYPVIPEANEDLSRAAEVTGAREICDFMTHPGENMYIEHLEWEEAVAGCEILEGLCTHRGTCENLFSEHTIYYLVRCLFISRWMFSGPPQSDRRLMMSFNCVRSAANALANICAAVKGSDVREDEILHGAARADMMDPVCFFVSNLGVLQPHLTPALLALQRDAAKSVLGFLREYARVTIQRSLSSLTADDEEVDIEVIRSLEPIGTTIIKVIKELKKVYEREEDLMVELLEKCCAVIEVISSYASGAKVVSAEWHSGKAFSEHLPPPLSGVGENGIYEENYKKGLMKMSPNLIRCLSNLCQTESGRGDCLSDGFLRRALDKFSILFPVVEDLLLKWQDSVDNYVKPIDVFAKAETPQQSKDLIYKVRECTSCLVLVGMCTNYTSYMYGAANDLILLAHYQLIERCVTLLRRTGKTVWSAYMEAALKCVVTLSEDNVRLVEVVENQDLVGLFKQVLMSIGDVPESAIKLAVTGLKVAGASLRTEYLALALPKCREPLQRVTRFHPALLDLVRDASWSVMKFIIDAEKGLKHTDDPKGPGRLDESDWDKHEFGTSSDSILNRRLLQILDQAGLDKKEASDMLITTKEQQQKSFQERLAAGTLLPHEIPHTHAHYDSPQKQYSDNLMSRGAKTYALDKDDLENKAPTLDKHGILDQVDVDTQLEGDLRGTSFECGPTNCGSLTLDDPSLQSHGAFKSTVTSERGAASSQELDVREDSHETEYISSALYGTLPAIQVSPIRKNSRSDPPSTESPGKPKAHRQAQQLAAKGKGKGKGKGSKKQEKKAAKLPMIIDISQAPEFMETRPPVDENAAYFC